MGYALKMPNMQNIKTLFACIMHKITLKHANKKEETPGDKTTYGAL